MTTLHKIRKRFDFNAEVCPCHLSKAPLQELPLKASPQHVVLSCSKTCLHILCRACERIGNASCIKHCCSFSWFQSQTWVCQHYWNAFCCWKKRGKMREGKNRVHFIILLWFSTKSASLLTVPLHLHTGGEVLAPTCPEWGPLLSLSPCCKDREPPPPRSPQPAGPCVRDTRSGNCGNISLPTVQLLKLSFRIFSVFFPQKW